MAKLLSPGDSLDGPYGFDIIPPTPNNPETNMSDKQDTPKEDKVVQHHDASRFDETLCPPRMSVVWTSKEPEMRYFPS